ncbi:MAG: bifunctional protein-serine/threonine kinase/phosphatase [Spongiibacteraceae bacterium]
MSEPVLHLQNMLQLTVGQASSAGLKAENEDAIGIRIPEANLMTTKGAVAAIADGVSAAEAGREASETCVHNFLSDYYATPESWTVKSSAQKVLTALNRWLFSQSQRFTDERKGYLTTLSVVVFKSHQAHLFHVGDSRIYRLRAKALEQLTRDHALAISDRQSYLTRAMGLDTKLDIDYRLLNLERGDVFILTTDGIHDFVSSQAIFATIDNHIDDFDRACKQLIKLALQQGSDDNLSCQLLRIDQLPDEQVNDVVSKLTALPFPPFLKKGMVLDGYKILREIYASARSQLYLVQDVESGQRYCMKTPSVNFDDDPAYIERFVMESWIGSRINNVHVVKVVDPGKKKSCLYYLTEYIDGLPLSQWIKENPRPAVQEVVYLVDQIAKGLRAFHRKETLHQDIKPDNILIDKRGVVKIIDFGACFVAGLAEIENPIVKDIALGTAGYSAPEHIMKKRPAYQSDIFSLAVVTYEMLTGKLPFDGKLEYCRTPADFLRTKYTPSYQINPLIPVWIDGALKKSLRYSPERRHQEVDEFVYELQHPNEKYLEQGFRPLTERNPLLFWKIITVALALTQLLSLYYLWR